MAEDTALETEITHLNADLEQVVKERDIVQKQLTSRLLPVHISLVIVLQLLLYSSVFAAYQWTEVNRLERLLTPSVENHRLGGRDKVPGPSD
ncbi:MAG: hypothetical protein OSA83_10095 [Pseudomonadales bacterium]|mgnify:CR=1 FL=1|jgi:hypothetical protein|nr:hypothetical protein [Pseudomonadales bacterium]|tara:strand:- start:358 stop:633 length:276 start_codon:yes stop_codon:yes gene_type:complete